MGEKNSSDDNGNLSLLLKYIENDTKQRKEEGKLREKQYRTNRTLKILLFIAFAFGPSGMFLTAYLLDSKQTGTSENPVALVRINGVIGTKTASSYTILPALDKAFEDENAKGVVILVNSPGGSPVQSSIIHDRIITLRNKYPEKKVYTIGEDMLTSGAYWIATGADNICVNQSTIVGSIGVISSSFGLDPDKYKQIGLERRIFTAGEKKLYLDPLLPVSKYAKEKMEEVLNKMHAHFIESIKDTRRKKLVGDESELFSGTFWTGNEALDLGLVDGLCDFFSVLDEEFNVDWYVDYTPRPGLFDSMRDSFKTIVSDQNTLSGIVEVIENDVLRSNKTINFN